MAVVLCGLAGGLWLAASSLVITSFESLEKSLMLQNAERGKNALLAEIKRLDTSAGDWAGWDDMYTYAQIRDLAFQEGNLLDTNFSTLRVDYLMVADNKGEILYAKGLHHKKNTPLPVPKSLTRYLKPGNLFQNWQSFPSLPASVNGFCLGDGQLLLVAARPILKSDQTGPPMGTLLLGRLLDDSALWELSTATQLPLTLRPYSPKTDHGLKAPPAPATTRIRPLGAKRVQAQAVINDLHGKAVSVLEITLPRDVLAQGRRSMSLLLSALLVVTGVGLLVLFGVLSWLVLNPLGRLHLAVNQIRNHHDLNRRVPEGSRDEIGLLGKEVNQMLQELDAKDKNLQSALAQVSDMHAQEQEERHDALKVQRALLPHSPWRQPGATVFSQFNPAAVMCGDFFDLARHGEHLVIFIADVSGHGASAAIVSVVLKTQFDLVLARTPPEETLSPENLLREMDRELARLVPAHLHYATALCGVFSPHTGELVFCRAGHPPPLVFMAGQKVNFSATHGLPPLNFISFAEEISPLSRNISVVLQPGARVLFYTDGVVDIFDAQHREWGVQGLEEAASKLLHLHGDDFLSALTRESDTRHHSDFPRDDQAMVLLEVENVAVPAPLAAAAMPGKT